MIKIKNFILSICNFISNTFYFKLLYLFISISISTMLLLIPGIRFLNKFLIAWGLLLIVINFIKLLISKRKLYSFEIVLYSFLTITLLLIISNYPTIENFKIWLINTLIFTVIFSIDSFKSKYKLKKELNIISFLFILFTFTLSSISTIMILFEYKVWLSETYKGEFINYGFSTIFANENSLGIIAILSFAISLYMLFNLAILPLRVFNIINCTIQILTMVLSNCRSAYLVIIALLFVYLYVYIKKSYVRLAIFFIPFIGLIGFLTFYTDKLGVLLSGREAFWTSALTLIKTSPLTGVGNSNLLPMIKAFNPPFLEALDVGGLHNIFLQIATVNGLIPLILIIVFIILLFLFLVKKLDTCYSDDKLKYTALLGLLIGIALINLLESNLVYGVNFINLLFWIYSGYLISIFTKIEI